MRNLLPLLIILACPLMMIFMMRGMHGGVNDDQQHKPDHQARSPYDPTSEDRIAELEREVAALREQGRSRDSTPASPR